MMRCGKWTWRYKTEGSRRVSDAAEIGGALSRLSRSHALFVATRVDYVTLLGNQVVGISSTHIHLEFCIYVTT